MIFGLFFLILHQLLQYEEKNSIHFKPAFGYGQQDADAKTYRGVYRQKGIRP